MELVNLVGNIILFYFHLLILCLNLLNYCVRIYMKKIGNTMKLILLLLKYKHKRLPQKKMLLLLLKSPVHP